MRIFGFVKKLVFVGLTILSGLASINSLSCISMSNRECKTRPQVVMLLKMSLCFFHLVLKQVNVVVAVIILTIRMQIFVFLMLSKIKMFKYLIKN